MSKTIAPASRGGKQRNEESFDIDEIATELILEHGAMILQDARRYSACLADAEDAYQRSLVIMLTKAPSNKPEELIPWLRVVVRREAAQIAKERNRELGDAPLEASRDMRIANEGIPEEHALDTFDVDLGVEALAKLKPDQIKCLLAQADGRSYAEIADATGFSARKVARNVNEGRRAFMNRVEAIESGTECARVDALLVEIAEGDTAAIESVRNHVKNCSGCRTAIREFSEAPRHATVLFPPALLTLSTATTASASPLEQISAVWHQSIERLNIHAHGAQQWIEAGTYKKAAAAVAITATVATGGAAVKELDDRRDATRDRSSKSVARATGPARLLDEIPAVRHASKPPKRKRARKATPPNPVATPQPVAPPRQASSANESIGDGSSEFLPEQR